MNYKLFSVKKEYGENILYRNVKYELSVLFEKIILSTK